MNPLQYWQLDVFAERPLAGNGVAVFTDTQGLSPATMQALTQELRQFEWDPLESTCRHASLSIL